MASANENRALCSVLMVTSAAASMGAALLLISQASLICGCVLVVLYYSSTKAAQKALHQRDQLGDWMQAEYPQNITMFGGSAYYKRGCTGTMAVPSWML